MTQRFCTRTGCSARAIATLTYVYAESTAVLGPLAGQADPNAYDLCQIHAQNLTPPRGWDVIRLPIGDRPVPQPAADDLLALADAVREVGFSLDPEPVAPKPLRGVVELGRRRHLTVLADPDV
ncbi:DUF3499 domain-containing protein [Mariniluteicoccus endophyticus]